MHQTREEGGYGAPEPGVVGLAHATNGRHPAGQQQEVITGFPVEIKGLDLESTKGMDLTKHGRGRQ